jgi:hypothetical protein
MNFDNFLLWLTKHFGERKLASTLGGKAEFNAKIASDRKSIFFWYGSKGNFGKLSTHKLKMIWDRYMLLGGQKNISQEYTDTTWRETPDRILAPYAAALIRDFELDFQNHCQ